MRSHSIRVHNGFRHKNEQTFEPANQIIRRRDTLQRANSALYRGGTRKLSRSAHLAAENAMYRAVQKEAAELGADAIIIDGPGIGPNYNGFRRGKALQALAIRWEIENQGSGPRALSPTSTVSTTRDANQVIPTDAPLYPKR